MSISTKPSMFGVHVPSGAVVAPAVHLYWRLYIKLPTTANDYAGIADMEMFSTAGTLVTTGGTPIASSTFDHPIFSMANAYDNNPSSEWLGASQSTAANHEWIGYRFASPVDVGAVWVLPRQANPSQRPLTFSVDYSDDGTAWTQVAEFTQNWTVIRNISFGLNPAPGAYANWRVVVAASQGSTLVSCAECELRETAAGPDLTTTATQYPIASDSLDAGHHQLYAFDNDPLTFWQSASNPPGRWVGYSLRRVVALRELVWKARTDPAGSPTSFTVQGSNDGTTWTDVALFSGLTWTAGESKTFNL